MRDDRSAAPGVRRLNADPAGTRLPVGGDGGAPDSGAPPSTGLPAPVLLLYAIGITGLAFIAA
ncbi:hypothetical protein GCM10018962_41360 [Dactylosporangium matsuzakiense]|uniref:Uncharacterized protein n=1 Tax=Dactylosporangium matsuzakiense TaxID=53360 RepID=A0A9W6KTP5_9ACTN|nr:hypothetical protein GCM10017581_096660 [Dactylosporangium matsuzakiense]